jgi:hypothetical protein
MYSNVNHDRGSPSQSTEVPAEFSEPVRTAIITENLSGMNVHHNYGSVFVADTGTPFRM